MAADLWRSSCPQVRSHAVSVLQQKDDEELLSYLLQLVQVGRGCVVFWPLAALRRLWWWPTVGCVVCGMQTCMLSARPCVPFCSW